MSCASVFAQSWQEDYGTVQADAVHALTMTPDGDLLLAGATVPNFLDSSALFLRLGTDADSLQYAAPILADNQVVWAIEPTLDGGYIAAGASFNLGVEEPFLTRLTANLDTLWTFTDNAPGTAAGWTDVVQLPDSSFALCGYATTSPTTERGLFQRISKDGVPLTGYESYVPNSNTARLNAMILHSSGDLVMTGYAVTPGNDREAYLLRTDFNGIVLADSLLPQPNSQLGEDLIEIAGGDVVIAGRHSQVGGRQGFLMRASLNGTVSFFELHGGSGTFSEFYALDEVPGGGYVAAGMTTNFGGGDRNCWMVRADALGQLIWENGYGRTNDDEARLPCTRDSSHKLIMSSISSLSNTILVQAVSKSIST
ncbi:MAG: hypothetical protein AAF570_07710, partial [Bacteroidota bacterium]